MKIYCIVSNRPGYAQSAIVEAAFTQPELAQEVKKVIPVCDIQEIELDKVSSVHAARLKEIFNIDIYALQEKIKCQLRDFTELDKECLMSQAEFEEHVNSGMINDDDGSGYWATETQVSVVSCWSEAPVWATHVCWYNQ